MVRFSELSRSRAPENVYGKSRLAIADFVANAVSDAISKEPPKH